MKNKKEYKMYPNEEKFAGFLESQGKAWAYEPIKFDLGIYTYCPDFYCPDDNIFYEVIGTACAFYTNRHKYKKLRDEYPEIKFKIVKPNGEDFFTKKTFKRNNGTIARQIRIPHEFDNKLIEIAEAEFQTMASVIRRAIKKYIDEYKIK